MVSDARYPLEAQRSAGFTLIELMVTLTLAAILAMIATPFAIAWMDSARQMQVRGDIVDAVSRAKSLALRNGDMRASGLAVSRIRLEDGLLTVENANTGNTLWSAQVPSSVDLTLPDEQPFGCVAYSSRGVPMIEASCPQSADRLLVKIAHREDLDVELL